MRKGRLTSQTLQLNPRYTRLIVPLGLLLAGLGSAFLPWLWREPVALQLTAPGLAEFVKFLPEVRTLQIQMQRLYFLLPLFVTMLGLPLFSAQPLLQLSAWLRWLMRLATIPLALAALPPVWTPTILLSSEFRLQTVLAVTALGLVVIAPLLRRVPPGPLLVLLVVGSLAAIPLSYWQFALVQSGLAEAYNQPVHLGWGWWLTAIGLSLAIAGAVHLSGRLSHFRAERQS